MAGNPETNAVQVQVGDITVRPRLTTNGLCAVEEALDGQSIEAIGKDMEKGVAAFRAVRAVFRAVLSADAPELTDVEAGRIVSDIGPDAAAAVIQSAFDALKAGGVHVTIHEPDVRGRVAFEASGVRYVMAFHFNALAELEPLFPGQSMPQIAAELVGGGVSVSKLRALFRAALIDDRELSLAQAGETIDRIGIGKASDIIGRTFLAAFPKEAVPGKDGDQAGNRKARRAAGSGGANPPKRPRKAGTGKP